MTSEKLRARLNREKIDAAVVGENRILTADEFIDARRMVWVLVENFAARDYEEFEIGGVEQEIEISGLKNQTQPIRGFIDVLGTIRGVAKEFKPFAGQKFILDWKSASTKLSTEWKDRLVDSWQWKIYSYHMDAGLAIYRGVNREDETREIIIVPQTTLAQEVEEYCAGQMQMRRSLVEMGVKVWPRTMKHHACGAFGRDCPYYEECRNYDLIPKEAILDRTMSYSQFENFTLCPERSRRDILVAKEMEDAGVEAVEGGATKFGKSVHRGMQEVYEQIRVLQQKYGFKL